MVTTRYRSGWVSAVLVAVASLVLIGCGGADSTAEPAAESTAEPAAESTAEPAAESTAPASTDADVTVVLGEWIVEPTPTSAAAGSLTMAADNQGGEPHEMVVARAADPADLPTDDDGAVDESQIPDEDFIGEIEEFPNGEQRTATFELDAGTYVLFCNITETEADGTVESHFVNGMATTFTVQ